MSEIPGQSGDSYYDWYQEVVLGDDTDLELNDVQSDSKIKRGVRGRLHTLGIFALTGVASLAAMNSSKTAKSDESELRPRISVQKLETFSQNDQTIDLSSVFEVSTPKLMVEPMVEPAVEIMQPRRPRYEFDLLVSELKRLRVRNPEELTRVMLNAWEESPDAPELPTILALAAVETYGKILAVSQSGAAGISQAMPLEVLRSGLYPLEITDSDAVGMLTYITKKPLGDAHSIAKLMAENYGDSEIETKVCGMMLAAQDLRREGFEDIYEYAVIMPPEYLEKAEAADDYNLKVLNELSAMINDGASQEEYEQFAKRMKEEYKELYKSQLKSWGESQESLIKKRDELLRRKYKMSPTRVMKERQYEAGEYLAEVLDVRFSPSLMAPFVIDHLNKKIKEAELQDIPVDALELGIRAYNGGWLNVLRSEAELIEVKESMRYLDKISRLSEKLRQCEINEEESANECELDSGHDEEVM